MATRGRPRSPNGPTTAADRKREFDRRMRNADGKVEGEPSRTPVVIYLSAEARDVMRRHREDAALAAATPLLDSKLVESLLLAFHAHRSSSSPTPVEAAALSTHESSVPRASDNDIERLRQLRLKIRRLNTRLQETVAERDELLADADDEESFTAERWSAIRRKLLDRHREAASLLVHPLANRLHSALSDLTSDAARMRVVSDELIEYLVTLLDALERSS